MTPKKPPSSCDVENVKVYVRVRPFNKKELAARNKRAVFINDKQNVIHVQDENSKQNGKEPAFQFDHVFNEISSQMDVYKVVAYPIVEQALQGYNGTIFAYGQTGSGKTFTMVGSETKEDLQGIIPNTFSHIFSHISRTKDKVFAVTVTYLEIYNEDVRDLLSDTPNAKLEVRERPDVGVYVKDLKGFTVDSIEQIMQLLKQGNTNRITHATFMNEVSSRSHAIFTIAIESRDKLSNKTTVGKLNFVDLAGSERCDKSQVAGFRLRETTSINTSLYILGIVIMSLLDPKCTHVPYRSSKLTRLLQDSLGGNTKTAMIAMISPSVGEANESGHTLRYAYKTKHIKNKAKVNVENDKSLIKSFESAIYKLQSQLSDIDTRNAKTMEKAKKSKDRAIMEAECRQKDEELKKTEKEKEELASKISVIQKKILVGGENLLEKAKQQQFLLEVSGTELQNLEENTQQLEETIHKIGAERIDIEEKYNSLQEEDLGITKKIKKVQTLLNEAKEEHAEKEHEYQREMETLLDNYRLLVRDLQLSNVMIEYYIPTDYGNKIESNLIWNAETAEYQMRGVAYTGNNMRKYTIPPNVFDVITQKGSRNVYHSYHSGKRSEKLKIRASSVPRPLSLQPKHVRPDLTIYSCV